MTNIKELIKMLSLVNNSLNMVEVKGNLNLNHLLGSIQTINGIIIELEKEEQNGGQ